MEGWPPTQRSSAGLLGIPYLPMFCPSGRAPLLRLPFLPYHRCQPQQRKKTEVWGPSSRRLTPEGNTSSSDMPAARSQAPNEATPPFCSRCRPPYGAWNTLLMCLPFTLYTDHRLRNWGMSKPKPLINSKRPCRSSISRS
jgi:hypothetical protein